MSTEADKDLLKIAEQVSDAETVDWEEASGGHPALIPALAGLRKIEAVADAFRAASTGDEGDGPRAWGRLDVLELIGAGSFGEVYRARDPLLDRDVALKLRKPRADGADDRRAIEEGRRLARVRHPNVLTVHGADSDRGRVGVWTELIEGPNLYETVREHGHLELDEAIDTAIAVARALGAVHGADLVHGDVKASNVFSDVDGRIVLGDFGSAAELDSSGTVSGSPVALAPERLRGAQAEPASDVYSLGVLLYFLLTGRYPVEGTSVEDILEQHETMGPVSLSVPRPDLPAGVVELVDRAVARDPSRRFTTAAELERALEETRSCREAPEPPSAEPATDKPAAPANPRKIQLWSLVFAAAAVAVLALITWAIISRPSAPPLVADARLVLDTADGPQILADGARVAPGDQLYLEIEAEEPVHVYVANEDEKGAVFTLFPIPGLDLVNPLPPGRHRLPGSVGGTANNWQVTSAGGVETFLVVASTVAVPEIEQRLGAWAKASADRAVGADPGGGPTLRGIGGLSEAPRAPGGGARLDELLVELPTIVRDGQTVWSRRIVLNSTEE